MRKPIAAIGAIALATSVSAHAGLFRATGYGTVYEGFGHDTPTAGIVGEVVAFTFDYDPARFVPQPQYVIDINTEGDPNGESFEDTRDFLSPIPIHINAVGSLSGTIEASFTLANIYNDSTGSGWQVGPLVAYGDGLDYTIYCEGDAMSCNGFNYWDPGYVDDLVELNAIAVGAWNGQVETEGRGLTKSSAVFLSSTMGQMRLYDASWSVSSVPEPGTWALMLMGVGATWLTRRKNKHSV